MTQLTGFKQDHIGSYIDKDPGAVLTYSIDWSDWLYGGDAIASTLWTVTAITEDPAGTALRIVSYGFLNDVSYAQIDRGTTGEIYTVTCKITTTEGNTDFRKFRIKVNPRYL